jgi:hypothetical protein
LGRSSVESSGGASRVLLAIASVGAKSAIRVLVSTGCCGKRLQVSDELSVLAWVALAAVGTATVRLWGAEQDRVVGVGLDVLFQILGTLESLAAKVALVRLQGDVDTDVRGDVVTLDGGGAAVAPLAGQVQVVCALATNMALADVVLGGC